MEAAISTRNSRPILFRNVIVRTERLTHIGTVIASLHLPLEEQEMAADGYARRLSETLAAKPHLAPFFCGNFTQAAKMMKSQCYS